MLRWAYGFLDGKGMLSYGEPTTAETFWSRAVMRLHWSYGAYVSQIACDMWFGIGAETFHPQKDSTAEFSTWVACDELEAGLAMTLRKFYKRYGAERERV